MGVGLTATTVTLDGRILVQQGRNILELPDAQTAYAVAQALYEAVQRAAEINGKTLPYTLLRVRYAGKAAPLLPPMGEEHDARAGDIGA